MHPYRKSRAVLALLVLFTFSAGMVRAQATGSPAADAQATAEGTVRELYKLVTFEPGSPPDWNKVRSLFISEAVVVLRTGFNQTSVFDVDGFVQDFVDFIEKSPAKTQGFTEKIVRLRTFEFGEMARITTLYEAHIPGTPRAPQQGIDVFLLTKKEGKWSITAVANEVVLPGSVLPDELRE